MLAKQPDITVADEEQKEAVLIDIKIPNDSNIRKKEYEKPEKYQSLKEELERMGEVKAMSFM